MGACRSLIRSAHCLARGASGDGILQACDNRHAANWFLRERENERQMASKTSNPFTFLQQVRQETAKVTWPSRRETMISTIMVLVFAFIACVFFFVADLAMGYAIELILGLGR
jgi:preprotein translocase subunit SecE